MATSCLPGRLSEWGRRRFLTYINQPLWVVCMDYVTASPLTQWVWLLALNFYKISLTRSTSIAYNVRVFRISCRDQSADARLFTSRSGTPNSGRRFHESARASCLEAEIEATGRPVVGRCHQTSQLGTAQTPAPPHPPVQFGATFARVIEWVQSVSMETAATCPGYSSPCCPSCRDGETPGWPGRGVRPVPSRVVAGWDSTVEPMRARPEAVATAACGAIEEGTRTRRGHSVPPLGPAPPPPPALGRGPEIADTPDASGRRRPPEPGPGPGPAHEPSRWPVRVPASGASQCACCWSALGEAAGGWPDGAPQPARAARRVWEAAARVPADGSSASYRPTETPGDGEKRVFPLAGQKEALPMRGRGLGASALQRAADFFSRASNPVDAASGQFEAGLEHHCLPGCPADAGLGQMGPPRRLLPPQFSSTSPNCGLPGPVLMEPSFCMQTPPFNGPERMEQKKAPGKKVTSIRLLSPPT
ncbi:unnamed protein product [Protopolystoma xenopodis]|uniref:Uncharacterized protein n=1 Tax=Protopolystoma xenopodis TaxID=117903 RepID=A0A3S5A6N6_9PLAT|nr:unnamed protein product [Protopolystoma xenopodis]